MRASSTTSSFPIRCGKDSRYRCSAFRLNYSFWEVGQMLFLIRMSLLKSGLIRPHLWLPARVAGIAAKGNRTPDTRIFRG